MTCNKCLLDKPENEFYYDSNSMVYRHDCKNCFNKNRNEKRRIIAQKTARFCNCGNKMRANNKSGKCFKCAEVLYSKTTYKRNKEKILKKMHLKYLSKYKIQRRIIRELKGSKSYCICGSELVKSSQRIGICPNCNSNNVRLKRNNNRKVNQKKLVGWYVKQILTDNGILSNKDIPEKLIQLKRAQLTLFRAIYKQQNKGVLHV